MNKDIFSIKGKIIVITGAAGLLGKQYASAIASFGAIPILIDIDGTSVSKVSNEINNKYDINSKGFEVDITNEKNIKKNCDELLLHYGKIDGLINNAAINPNVSKKDEKHFSRLENFTLQSWNSELAVGLTGAFLCSKHYGTAISNNLNGGVIINISSDLGLIAPDQTIYFDNNFNDKEQPVKPITYSVIKTGLIGLTRYLSTYWPNKVRCNTLCPGGVNFDLPDDFVKEVSKRIPMGRMAEVNEYSAAIIFLLSDASSYMTGSNLIIDGGRTVW